MLKELGGDMAGWEMGNILKKGGKFPYFGLKPNGFYSGFIGVSVLRDLDLVAVAFVRRLPGVNKFVVDAGLLDCDHAVDWIKELFGDRHADVVCIDAWSGASFAQRISGIQRFGFEHKINILESNYSYNRLDESVHYFIQVVREGGFKHRDNMRVLADLEAMKFKGDSKGRLSLALTPEFAANGEGICGHAIIFALQAALDFENVESLGWWGGNFFESLGRCIYNAVRFLNQGLKG